MEAKNTLLILAVYDGLAEDPDPNKVKDEVVLLLVSSEVFTSPDTAKMAPAQMLDDGDNRIWPDLVVYAFDSLEILYCVFDGLAELSMALINDISCHVAGV